VHLPRTIQVEGDSLFLGLVSVVRAGDEALARKAADILMGRAPWPREEIVIDRPTILGRLASHGIAAGNVQLSGADKVVVSRNEKTISAGEIARAAEAALQRRRPPVEGCRWRVLREPQAMIVPGFALMSLEAALVPHEITGEAKMEVAAVADGRRLGSQTVLFKLSYLHREAVAKSDLAPGTVLVPDNVEIRPVTSDVPAPVDWTAPYGLALVQAVRAGGVIRPTILRSPRATVVVRRGENVVMRVQGACFLVRGLGQAMEDGKVGDAIKVRNIDSGRTIVAKVAPDGAVEPVFGEGRS
jgi:flagella basal body P-ring formation protein FlgA